MPPYYVYMTHIKHVAGVWYKKKSRQKRIQCLLFNVLIYEKFVSTQEIEATIYVLGNSYGVVAPVY